MTADLRPKRGIQISTGGIVVGVLLGAFYLLVAFGLRYAVGVFQNYTQGFGSSNSVTFNVFSFISGPIFIPLVVAIVAVKVAHRAIKEPRTLKGSLQVVLGALSGSFYYLILGGGTLLLTIAVTGTTSGSAAANVSLVITLILLELSAGTKIVQGLLEYREARKTPAPATSATPPAPPVPTETARTCANCGAPLGENDQFCTRCGSQQP
jgi:zinc-ribbon domain